jgi:excinuclease UvrABC nuclease subunit
MTNKIFLENLPTSPGVYKMLDDEKNILYVGKSW